jgi:ribosomal protein L37AE/L43A
MNPYFQTILYAALRRRVTCSFCGKLDHHKMLGQHRFLCKSCGKEFKHYPGEK